LILFKIQLLNYKRKWKYVKRLFSGSDMSSDTFQGIGKKQVERVFFPAQPVF